MILAPYYYGQMKSELPAATTLLRYRDLIVLLVISKLLIVRIMEAWLATGLPHGFRSVRNEALPTFGRFHSSTDSTGVLLACLSSSTALLQRIGAIT